MKMCRTFTRICVRQKNKKMAYLYKTHGTCSTNIEIEVDNGILKHVRYYGGCNGNLKAIAKLLEGMPVEEVVSKLEGISCGNRSTSCSDQLCKALREMGVVK